MRNIEQDLPYSFPMLARDIVCLDDQFHSIEDSHQSTSKKNTTSSLTRYCTNFTVLDNNIIARCLAPSLPIVLHERFNMVIVCVKEDMKNQLKRVLLQNLLSIHQPVVALVLE